MVIRGRLHLRFRIRFSIRFACKSDGDMILYPISRPTPIDTGRVPNFGKQILWLTTGHQQGIGWQIGQRIGCNKTVRVDAQFSCRTENRITIRFA
jgi:hypothetical protein